VKCLPSIVYRDEKAVMFSHAQPIPIPCIPGAATEIEMSDVYVASYPENPIHLVESGARNSDESAEDTIQYTFFKQEYFYCRSPLTAEAEEVCWFACWALDEKVPLNGEDMRCWRWGVVGMGYVGHGKTVLGGFLWGGGAIEGGWRGGGVEGGWSSINSSEHVEGMLRMNCGTVGLWDNRVKIRGWM